MKFITGVLAVTLLTAGCARSSNSNNTAKNDTQNKQSIEIHKQSECPQNIDGVYEGKLPDGKIQEVRIKKDVDGVLTFRTSVENQEPLVIVVNGQKNHLDKNSYIVMSCSSSKITSITHTRNVTTKAEFTFIQGLILVDTLEPEHLMDSYFFRRVFP